ncbi:PREDICTED: zinc finger protein CONSTANS-LIKE 16-like isoform X2 [Brassica oleracea var. oleracea]|uniref:zinc finger protein CONSTANS-LIKE 16-like isoform X2 n=1 Tax=Brassica oleracea var. oleracea TaxID=109376 RepID=UPI0006A74BC3|nr:PREDICTED: zinc finger protein CONSTANS-LIKE 16-like isoform X2 [Brassica oleracea var. oleracea]
MKSLASAVGAKTARACDSCVKRRARWYCAADDAFLCQSCDTLVHSANLLARRHERVLLKSASKHSNHNHNHSPSSPPHEAATWHHGFTRKPRTPRGSGKKNNLSIFHDLVPEISVEDQTESCEREEQLICQVPVLDPTVAEQLLNDVAEAKIEFPIMRSGVMMDDQEDVDNAESCLNGFFPTDMELEEYATDVESLLGRGLDTESYAMEELGLSKTEMFKIEKEEETKDMNIGICDDDRDATAPFEVKEEEKKNVLMLRLNYDSVISTWGGQGPPWTSGEPPERDIDISSWPFVSMVGNVRESQQKHHVGGCLPSSGFGDGGREARVSRYREKRRTRLFSKKIRYEVRKLNAEKRPRMKGRFVKRASLAVSAMNSPLGMNY